MKPITELKELQTIEYKILEEMDRYFCRHNLNYILAYGTMLGAVRHKGFIPWDDDIDIFMLRPDYEKLKEMARKDAYITEEIAIRVPGMKNYTFPFIKVVDITTKVSDEMIRDSINLQVWIDIFPLDHLPDGQDAARNVMDKCKKYRRILNTGILKNLETENRLKSVMKKLLFLVWGRCEGLCGFIDYYGKKCDKKYGNSKTLGNIVWAQYGKDFFEVTMLFPTKRHTFEKNLFYIPEQYDAHLRYMYGDYMTPPPEDRRTRHFITAYKNQL